jgi:lysophospholipase L1-like esterase
MKRRTIILLVIAFALVAGCFQYYKKCVRPSQLEENTWNKYSASGKWPAGLNEPAATTIIGDSHIIELDFGQIDRRPVQGLAYRGATSLLLTKLADTIVLLEPEVSIVMIGSNDVLFGIDTALSSSRWTHFISMLKLKQESGIYMVNIPPLHVARGLFTSPSRITEDVANYNKMLATKAHVNGVHIVDLHAHIFASGEPESYFKADGIHLNEHGYKLLVTLINDALAE